MKRTPADSSGSQEMHSFSRRGDQPFLNRASLKSVFSHLRHSQVQREAEGDLVDEQANEQALLELMLTIVDTGQGYDGDSGSHKKVIESQIVTQEEVYRRALVDHVTRLKEGEQPIGVCVFITSSLAGKYTCLDDVVQMLCRRHGGPVSNVRKLILGRWWETDEEEGIRMRLSDVFGEVECSHRLRWAGDGVSIIKSHDRLDSSGGRYHARLEAAGSSVAEGRNLYVMLKTQAGNMACAKLTPDNPCSVLAGGALPDDWDAVFLGLAVD